MKVEHAASFRLLGGFGKESTRGAPNPGMDPDDEDRAVAYRTGVHPAVRWPGGPKNDATTADFSAGNPLRPVPAALPQMVHLSI